MPTIELIPKRKKSARERGYTPTEKATMASSLYNTEMWRRLRKSCLMETPECVMCTLFDRVKLADCVHHIDEISKADNPLEAKDRAFDSNNLMSLCSDCHNRIHAIIRHGAKTKADKEFITKYNEYIKKTRKIC